MRNARFTLIGCAALLAFGDLRPGSARADTPTTLVASGAFAVSYPDNLFADPATFWYSIPDCTDFPGPQPGEELSPAVIMRGTTYAAPPRELFRFNPVRGVAVCNPYKLISNVAADGTSIYFIDNQGPSGHFALQRRSRTANASEPSTLLVDFGTTLGSAEVNAQYPTVLLVILRRPANFDVISEYRKSDGALLAGNLELGAPGAIGNMQYDGKFLYWLNGHTLRKDDTTNGNMADVVTANITTYFAEGFNQGQCGPEGCADDVAWVDYAVGNQILQIDGANGGGSFPIYTSPMANASIMAITRDNQNRYYFFERRPANPGGVFDKEDLLMRDGVLIYGPVNNGGLGFDALTTDFSFLYFHDRAAGALRRLPTTASAVPIYDLRGTGVELTQGIQSPTNDVSLYSGRRTFARFYVKSFGATDVPNVTAALNVSSTNGFLGRLDPVNAGGKLLTVKRDPKRVNINDSFLFELPLAWTRSGNLVVTGTVNPLAGVVENNYNDNSASSPLMPISDSPRLNLGIMDFRYNNGGSLVSGGVNEAYQSVDYMNRIYPLALPGGGIIDPGDGLHFFVDPVVDDAMKTHVDQTHKDCASLLVLNGDGSVKSDNRNMCAGNYALATIKAMRTAGTLPTPYYYYGAIANDGTLPNTRGFTQSGDMISVGPKLDFNGTPQQNYMSHEIGHALGRGHPFSGGNPVCPGQSADDTSFPNPKGRIGNSSNAAGDETADMGFDPGQAGNANQPQVLRLASVTGDVMSYCPPYWISSYTYAALWTKLTFFPPAAAALPRAAGVPLAAAIHGDWLVAVGDLSVASQAGTFAVVSHLDSVTEVPPLVPGGYALELRNAGGGLLASHPFTPSVSDEASPDERSFSLVLPFVAGTRSLRLVDTATAKVLAIQAVSVSAPIVSNVAFSNPPNPLHGVVPLTWNATDTDGDLLHYDVYYSRDAGVSWRPLQRSLATKLANIDTDDLGGGSGLLRVEASDGAQTGRAQSAPFSVSLRAPVVRIVSPAAEIQIQWGQLVNFAGQADDPQQQALPETAFVWSSKFRTLGVGRAITVTDLEVGSYPVVLTVKGAGNLLGSASVPVVVGDRVSYPGPRLSATPSPITWTVPALGAGIQSAALQVVNAGGAGSLPFTATASPGWLHVNGGATTSASAPAAVPVTADPSGLPAGQTSLGQIVITDGGDPNDTITIPVTLVKGNAFVGAAPADSDGDGVPDTADNCIVIANPTQLDSNGDGFGNACDPDLNNDGIVNFADLAKLKSVFFSANADADLNGDGVVNFTDLARMKAFFFKAPGPSGLVP